VNVSVVTPSYKQLCYLKLCAASVSDQVGIDKEHVIQDGGTGAELDSWAASQPALKLYIEKDSGMYDAINRGLRRATGEICAYLNCDEQYLPGTLKKVAAFFESRPNIDVLFGDVILINPEGKPLSYRRTVLPTLRHIQLAHLNTPTCATFFRKTLLDRGFYFDPTWRSVGDAVWIENLLKAGVPMAVLHQPLAVFTQTGQNLGANSATRAEASRRRKSVGSAKIRTAAVVLQHRLRKALAGAYRPRHVKIEIFTPDSPNMRKRIAAWVGFGWRTE
jgi:glycosyltransferase involved in cell wall biosynthesis